MPQGLIRVPRRLIRIPRLEHFSSSILFQVLCTAPWYTTSLHNFASLLNLPHSLSTPEATLSLFSEHNVMGWMTRMGFLHFFYWSCFSCLGIFLLFCMMIPLYGSNLLNGDIFSKQMPSHPSIYRTHPEISAAHLACTLYATPIAVAAKPEQKMTINRKFRTYTTPTTLITLFLYTHIFHSIFSSRSMQQSSHSSLDPRQI